MMSPAGTKPVSVRAGCPWRRRRRRRAGLPVDEIGRRELPLTAAVLHRVQDRGLSEEVR
jgi:hypothetical protein